MASNAGNYIYTGPWGPGPFDAAQRMFDFQKNKVNKTQVTGFGAYKSNAILYQSLVDTQAKGGKVDAGRSRAKAGAAGGGQQSVAARNARAKFDNDAGAPLPDAPTAPDVQAPVYHYIDPRDSWGLFNFEEGQYSSSGPTGQFSGVPGKTGIEGYNAAFASGRFSQEGMFAGLNLELQSRAEQLGDFKLLTELGQPAWTPAQFDEMKRTYDQRYKQDVKDFAELQQIKASSGSPTKGASEGYKTEKAEYDAGDAKAKGLAGAAGESAGGGGQVGVGQGATSTEPGLAWTERDDSAWI